MDRHSNAHLGVNKIGKNIRKGPLQQPNFTYTARQPPQPHVYNINKNDFRNVVQQLTGSPSQEPMPKPPQNLPKLPSMRLQKIRPPPLTPINQPQISIRSPMPIVPENVQPRPPVPYGSKCFRPPAHFGQPSPSMLPPLTPSDSFRPNVAESPVSAYMRYLENSMINSGPRQMQSQPFPSSYSQVPGQFQSQPQLAVSSLPFPRMNGPPPLPSPRMNGPPLLPSPTSQFLLQSPTGWSPYPLLSPEYQQPSPFTPNFSFSPTGQSRILGLGPQPQPSPGYGFPLSPGFFSFSSPRWREQ